MEYSRARHAWHLWTLIQTRGCVAGQSGRFSLSGAVRSLPVVLLVAAGLAAGTAAAQSWPVRPVTLIVGTPPGGALDVYARALAEQLGKTTGGTFLVDYKAGANGNISAEHVLKAPPDGHTLWIGTHAMMTINPSAYSKLRWKQSDFKPIAKGVEAPLVLVTHPSVPARTLAQLTVWLKENPGKAHYASFSSGTPSQFLGYQLSEQFKLNMVHVPYKGSAPQVNDLLAGQVFLGFTQLQTALPYIQSGKLNAIVITGPTRSRLLPQTPTLAEAGQKNLTTTIWFGLLAPSAVPQPVLQAIEAAAVKVQADAGYRGRLWAQGFDVSSEHGPEFARSITAETTRWAEVIRATGFRAND